MTFTISGVYQHNTFTYEVESNDFEVFMLTRKNEAADERFLPEKLTLFREIKSSSVLENQLLELIDEWRNTSS